MTAKKKPPPTAPAAQRAEWAKTHTNLALSDLDKNLAELRHWRTDRGASDTDAEIAAIMVAECADRLEYLRLFTERGTP